MHLGGKNEHCICHVTEIHAALATKHLCLTTKQFQQTCSSAVSRECGGVSFDETCTDLAQSDNICMSVFQTYLRDFLVDPAGTLFITLSILHQKEPSVLDGHMHVTGSTVCMCVHTCVTCAGAGQKTHYKHTLACLWRLQVGAQTLFGLGWTLSCPWNPKRGREGGKDTHSCAHCTQNHISSGTGRKTYEPHDCARE